MNMHPKIPSQSEIRNCFGPTLAETFMELSDPPIRTFVEVTPPLKVKGPAEHLWHTPSDQLIKKNSLKLPMTSSMTQAATHRGIIGLGEKALRQFQVDVEKRVRESLFIEIKNIHLLFEAEQRHVTNTRIKKIEDECTWRTKFLIKEYDKKLEKTLDDVITRYNEILQKALVQTRMSVTLEMMKKMRKEVEFIVTDLNADYDRRCSLQRQNMIADFNVMIRKERVKLKDMLRICEKKKVESLERIRVKVENEFQERAEKLVGCEKYRCNDEKRKICENLEKIMLSLQKLLDKTNEEIANVKGNPSIIISPNNSIWKWRIKHILQAFRKLMKFFLNTAPDRANSVLPRRDSLLQFPNDDDDSIELIN